MNPHGKRTAILISGRGSNMTALIEAAKADDYPAAIVLVLSNRPDAAGLQRARAEGINTAVVDHRPFGEDRDAFEHALDAELHRHHIDLICLAGFMRLFTKTFVERWSGRMLNIHPALLPQFKGLHTHRRALGWCRRRLALRLAGGLGRAGAAHGADAGGHGVPAQRGSELAGIAGGAGRDGAGHLARPLGVASTGVLAVVRGGRAVDGV